MHILWQIKLILALAILLTVTACSLPLKVDKVTSMKDPVKGVRYLLKRPSYSAGLRIDLNKTRFYASPDIESKYKELKPTEDAILLMASNEESKWITGVQNKPQPHYCLKEGDMLNIILQQNMNGPELIYEATSRDTPPHWFADSESSITMDDDGYLTAIMAGETDKSLEFIQAIAGLAISGAKKAVAPLATETKPSCLLIKDEKFHNYITEHIRVAALKKNLTDNINNTLKNLNSSSPEIMKIQLESLSLLRTELEQVEKKLETVQYEMPAGTFAVVDSANPGTPLVPAEKPWVRFDLTSL